MALRGSGGEIVRTAVTCFISNMAEAKFPCHTDQDVIELWKISLGKRELREYNKMRWAIEHTGVVIFQMTI